MPSNPTRRRVALWCALTACVVAPASAQRPAGMPGRVAPGGQQPTAAPTTASTTAATVMLGREQTADVQVVHALNRLAFGPRPGDVARVRAMGVDRWIDAQLHPERLADTTVERLLRGYTALDQPVTDLTAASRLYRQARRAAMQQDSTPPGASRRTARPGDMAGREELRLVRAAVTDVESAKLLRAVASERQLQEVLVDFWANHFSVFRGKGDTRLYLGQYDRDVIRPHTLGRFRDLLGAVAKSPAMLFYLDNWQSVADTTHRTLVQQRRGMAARGRRPAAAAAMPGALPQRRPRGVNENYARELLELHTLGVDGGYTQRDVMEVARALTGWSIDRASGTFVFRAAAHDAEPKRVLGTELPGGRGIEDGEAVLDLLARHPATARFIARKLVVRFVSDTPPPALVERAARTFERTDGDLRAVVRTIVTSDEFFGQDVYRAKVKSPFELVASALRATGAVPDTTPRTAQLVTRLGQPIYGRQTPDGWPETGGAWMNAGAILNRMNVGLQIAGGRLPGAGAAQWPAAAGLRTAPRERQVETVIAELLGGDVSRETRTVLMTGRNPLLERAATAPSQAGGSEMTPAGRRVSGLAQIVGLALGAPEFQRR